MLPALAPRRALARFRPPGWTPWRRLPFPALALAVGLLFAAVGVAVLDDYGISHDESVQRRFAAAHADYIMGGDRDALSVSLDPAADRFYGIAFELPLLLAERALGLQDSRDIYLARHLITHLFFIAGGFICGLLAWRMFNNRWLALLAMLLFLLHPRLYAHSFFNSKDVPFAVMFVIALYLTHRAFRRDTLGAFALLGVVVGLAANMRPFALLFIPAVLALRGLDFWPAPGGASRRRILLTAGVFAAAALLALYASHPYYWESPLSFIDGIQILSRHPSLLDNLFRGRIVPADAVPAGYIPVWFGITAPPLALLLGAAGMAAILWRGFRAPGQALRKGELRFLLLLLGCFVLPIAAVIVWQTHIYHGWRQMYFLWGPFCLLAAAGLHSLPAAGGGRNRRRRLAGYGLALAGLGAAAYAMVSLHPHQQVYFNPLANRAAPEQLRLQYDMDYWWTAQLQGLEYLLEYYPEATLNVRWQPGRRWYGENRRLLPAAERERIAPTDVWEADFRILSDRNIRHRPELPEATVYQRRAYGSAYLLVTAPRLIWGAGLRPGADDYRAAYRRVTAAGPAAQSEFDVYIHDGALYYVRENCRREDAAPRVFLHLYPVNNDDLPGHRREYGFNNRNFNFGLRGGFFDGKCITQEPLPDYPLARISTGQVADGEARWQAEINPPVLARFQKIEAGLAGLRPIAAAGGFELYRDGGLLVYRREICDAADTAARFYLHLFPANAADLPANRQAHGFVNRGFSFAEYGAMRDGKCLASVPLPDYPIARIRTGQHTPEAGQLWQADFPADAGR